MTIRQLHYTSCEQGLSGFAGFQFNAATPGVPASAYRYVETLTAYEPPNSLGFEPTEAAIAGCPVALMYAQGEASVVANVVFTGADFTNRFGNYFAHALVTDEREYGFGEVLAIELWGAALWVSEEGGVRDLPELETPLSTGSINRAAIQTFLDGHRFAASAAALLSAAARSVCDEDRSLVIVDDDDEAIARWIALLSFTLPARIVHAMSFTTFHNRPAYCPLRVVGTVPDGDVDRSDAAFDSLYYLFDFTSGRATAIEVHPLARILAEEGPLRSEAIWRRAYALARGDEQTLDDWYPVVLVSLEGTARTPSAPETDIVISWLVTEAARLGSDRLGCVAGPIVARPLTESQLTRLSDAARGAGSAKIVENAEMRLVDMSLDALLAGGRPGDYSLTTRQAARHATQRCTTALNSDTPQGLAVLGWAAKLLLPLDRKTRLSAGRRVIGPALFVSTEKVDATALAGADQWILAGVVAYLEGVASSDPRSVDRLLDQPIGGLLEGATLDTAPTLHELVMLAMARRDPAKRVRALDSMLSLREDAGEASPAWLRETLGKLWPDEVWTPREAQQVVTVLRDEEVTAAPIVERLRATLHTDHSFGQAYVELCRAVRESPVFAELPAPAASCVARAEIASERIRRVEEARGSGDLARAWRDLRDALEASSGPVRQAVWSALLKAMDRLPGPELAEAFRGATEDLDEEFRRRLEPALDAKSPNIDLVASALHAVFLLAADRSRAGPTRMERMLGPAVSEWRRRDVTSLAKQLAAIDPRLESRFRAWLESQQAGQEGRRFLRRREKP